MVFLYSIRPLMQTEWDILHIISGLYRPSIDSMRKASEFS